MKQPKRHVVIPDQYDPTRCLYTLCGRFIQHLPGNWFNVMNYNVMDDKWFDTLRAFDEIYCQSCVRILDTARPVP